MGSFFGSDGASIITPTAVSEDVITESRGSKPSYYNDWIDGGGGDDFLVGGGGDDTILGGDGDDVIYGDGQSGFETPVVFSAATPVNFIAGDPATPVEPAFTRSKRPGGDSLRSTRVTPA